MEGMPDMGFVMELFLEYYCTLLSQETGQSLTTKRKIFRGLWTGHTVCYIFVAKFPPYVGASIYTLIAYLEMRKRIKDMQIIEDKSFGSFMLGDAHMEKQEYTAGHTVEVKDIEKDNTKNLSSLNVATQAVNVEDTSEDIPGPDLAEKHSPPSENDTHTVTPETVSERSDPNRNILKNDIEYQPSKPPLPPKPERLKANPSIKTKTGAVTPRTSGSELIKLITWRKSVNL
mmetsp:Transcript_13303/g.16572  ORF Transcript_13303/g.16572 Transcript_13303/m.16572 type:complete len:230 (+) Transcript_13303:392-1081(+)